MANPSDSTEDRAFVRRTLVVAGTLIAVAGVLWLISALSNILFMIFVALFIAIALEPPVFWLSEKGWRRGAAAGLVFLAGFLLVGLFVVALVPLFAGQINQLANSIPGYIADLFEFMEANLGLDLSGFEPETAGQDAVGFIQSLGGTLIGGIVEVTAGIAGFFVFGTTVALFSFYMVAEMPKLQSTVLSFMERDQQRRALQIWRIAVDKMGGYIYSRLILAIISAAVTIAFLSFLGIPFAFPLGLWVGVLSQFIPVVGTYLAAILPVIVTLSSARPLNTLWVVLFFIAYQQVENLVFAPRITKRTMEIHPAVSIAAIFAGASLLGGIGVILALPVTGIIQAIISESRKRHDVVLDEDPEPASA